MVKDASTLKPCFVERKGSLKPLQPWKYANFLQRLSKTLGKAICSFINTNVLSGGPTFREIVYGIHDNGTIQGIEIVGNVKEFEKEQHSWKDKISTDVTKALNKCEPLPVVDCFINFVEPKETEPNSNILVLVSVCPILKCLPCTYDKKFYVRNGASSVALQDPQDLAQINQLKKLQGIQ